MSAVFLAWRDPNTRGWFPIGRLGFEGQLFEFIYTKGMLAAQASVAFKPLPSFPDPYARYLSTELFPLFSNRLPSPSRPEFLSFIEWIGAPESPNDPIAMLGLSGGRRVTDTFEMFPHPVKGESGGFHIRFFLHGLSHMSTESQRRADHLRVGERLLLQHDFQNPFDPRALMVRTAENSPNDLYSLGYCPRYLIDDLFEVIRSNPKEAVVTVVKVNAPPAPTWFRVLCSLSAVWPLGYQPFSGEQYQPVGESLPVRFVTSSTAAHMPYLPRAR